MEPYDPRQWTRSVRSGAQMVFQQRGSPLQINRGAVSGHESVLPSPPPPYTRDATDTPSTTERRTPVWEAAAFAASPVSVDGLSHVSPQMGTSPAFPPPPSQSGRFRERAASGLANQLLNFSGLRNQQSARVDVPASPAYVPTPTFEPRPPASRRAASTGHMHELNSHHRSIFPTIPANGDPSCANGMTLPGPPPGPPPNASRSQSLNRIPSGPSSRTPSVGPGQEFLPRRAAIATSLDPIPPTPAHWIDSDHPCTPGIHASQQQQHQRAPSPPLAPDYQPLRIDTGVSEDLSRSERLPHRRDGSIRERRSRSRAARDGTTETLSNFVDEPRSAIVASPTEGAISRRRGHMRTASGFPHTLPGPPLQPPNGISARATSQPAIRHDASVMTPPLTAESTKAAEDSLRRRSAVRKAPGSATSDRPLSQLLSARNRDDDAPLSVSPRMSNARPPSTGSLKTSTKVDPFYLKAMERHRTFIDKEASATSDEERLELFASFIVHESRLRRDQYSAAYTAMASDILDLTRDMWRSYTKHGKRVITPSTSTSSFEPAFGTWASDGQPTSAYGNVPSSVSSFGDFTPANETKSNADPSEGFARSASRQWVDEYKPSLSPIPSMAVSATNDGDSSRGRKSSRWWEEGASNSGDGSIGRPDRIERSRRETKYMGVTAATLQDMDPASHLSPDTSRFTPTPGASMQSFTYGPDEYPPEKAGLREGAYDATPMATPGLGRERKSSSPGVGPLDVSRLVTLPPPYPRHHPAINNNHPLLADLRSEHRALADLTAIRDIKEAYVSENAATEQEQLESAKDRRAQIRRSIQDKIASNIISYAEAAQAEADFELEEAQREKAKARSDFDVFETKVAQPLNELITQRLGRATECVDRLRSELADRNQSSDPNQAQEEGDEHPERLEQLTLLKWIFETREQLHKEMFDLHAERSAKYSEVVLTPFRISKLQSKINDATAFFARDAQERQVTFAKEAAQRFEQLQGIVDVNVTRGVEAQLSAFWDIAPGLLQVIQHVPRHYDPSTFEVLIPQHEYDENPALAAHPMQYLYSLLAHAEKSAYQFIESQINLLCLLHEVRTASAQATLRLLEVQRRAAGADGGDGNDDDENNNIQDEIRRATREREQALTKDLQEKVGEVERQWREAVGEALKDCKWRVKQWLEQDGGWEDGLE